MNPLNLLSNHVIVRPTSDRESPPARTESTSSTDNSTIGNSLHLRELFCVELIQGSGVNFLEKVAYLKTFIFCE
jgi:hypothetical protein